MASVARRETASSRRAAFTRLVVSCCGLAAASLGLCKPAATATSAAELDRIEMRIEMFGFGGAHVATNRTVVEEATDRYAITTDAESRGIAAVLVPLTSHSEVVGRLGPDAVRPLTYRGEVHRSGVDTRSRVDYAADGTVTGDSTPPGRPPTPVTPALMRGTVDQLTALFMIERQLAARGSCAGVVAVFDGRRRYDLHFTDAAPEAITVAGKRGFAAPTQVCHMQREALAGFRDDAGLSEGAHAGKLWYARLLPGDLMIPVQMQFSTEFGEVTGYLGELRGRGVHLLLME
jgi:Protein of unknown function (DUF3108)